MDDKKRKLLLRIGCGVIAAVFIFSVLATLMIQVLYYL